LSTSLHQTMLLSLLSNTHTACPSNAVLPPQITDNNVRLFLEGYAPFLHLLDDHRKQSHCYSPSISDTVKTISVG